MKNDLKLIAEYMFFQHYITDLYPTGVCSYVSDTYNFFDVISKIAPALKDKILARQPNALGLAKTVFRPDSGDPVKIICGYSEGEYTFYPNISAGTSGVYVCNETKLALHECEVKGAVECLWDVFGGTVNEAGYKHLHERVGLIYGDSITVERAEEIMKRLKAKGFASTNVVFGIGSFTYQYNTRDTFGFAMKATHAVVNGEERELFKDPVTDSGTKKSARGLLRVENEDGKFVLYDQQTPEQEKQGLLRTVFKDGKLVVDEDFQTIRNRLLTGN